jgi:hypothetical protein
VEAEPRAHWRCPWGRGHRAEVGTAGSPTPPYRVGARAAARASLPTTSTYPARAMAPPPAICRILPGSHRQEGDQDCSSAGMAKSAAEGQRQYSRGEAGWRGDNRTPGWRGECTGKSCHAISHRLSRIGLQHILK